jgi:hypothetical protein
MRNIGLCNISQTLKIFLLPVVEVVDHVFEMRNVSSDEFSKARNQFTVCSSVATLACITVSKPLPVSVHESIRYSHEAGKTSYQ